MECLGTKTDERGIKHDQWRIACQDTKNPKQRKNFIPKIWPFEDDSGNSILTIKQPKSGQTCKKAMANRFKTNRVIRCEHDESKYTGCQCSKFAER